MDATEESKPFRVETGLIVRIEREGGWGNFDIGQLQPAEIGEFFGTKERADLINWLVYFIGAVVGQCSIKGNITVNPETAAAIAAAAVQTMQHACVNPIKDGSMCCRIIENAIMQKAVLR